jgi:glyoxylase-like metal-dependent hydrolase (beta-lactamase superfamily II)
MASPRFETLDGDEVVYGRVDQVSPTIRRVIAENPSKFTYFGTGTYIVGRGDVVVIDPGPILDSHRDALASALAGERVRAILITHCHADHSPLAAWLKDDTGAPTVAFGPHPRPTIDEMVDLVDLVDIDGDDEGVGNETKVEESTDHDFLPDHEAVDGEVVFEGAGCRLSAVHTPGHTSNHLCYAYSEESALFSGDHVMGWSTTVVSPPDGDMAAYVDSLHKVAGRHDGVLWPTHGPPRYSPAGYVSELLAHRLERERQVLEQVRAGVGTVAELVEILYADVRPELHTAAGRSVLAHVLKLVAEGKVGVEGDSPPGLSSKFRA